MGRPPLDTANKKTKAIQLRLTEPEQVLFARLVEARAAELEGEAVTVTDAGVMRWLFLREVAARGLDKDRPDTKGKARR